MTPDSDHHLKAIIRFFFIPIFIISLLTFWGNLIALIVPGLKLYFTAQSFNEQLAMTFTGFCLVLISIDSLASGELEPNSSLWKVASWLSMIIGLFIIPLGIINQELADGDTLQNILQQHWYIVGGFVLLAFCVIGSFLSFKNKPNNDESPNTD